MAGNPLTVAGAADKLGVAPARVRALIENGALVALPGEVPTLAAADVAELTRRGSVRAVDVAAVESALDRALKRRLPVLLENGLATALSPLADEVSAARAAAVLAAEQVLEAESVTAAVVADLSVARARIVELDAQVHALAAKPVGLFRRRRVVVSAALPA